MLHLDARVHLQKVEGIALDVDQKLDRAGAAVGEARRKAHRRLVQRASQALIQPRRRALLDELLIAALHRAVPLAQVDHPAGAVAQHLHLDVPGARHVALEVEARVTEARLRFGGGELERRRQLGELVDELHAPSPAATDRLDEQRHPDAARQLLRLRPGEHRCARYDRHAGRLGGGARLQLVAHRLELRRGRADEHEAVLLAQARERGTFGEEAVARMHGLGAGAKRRLHDRLHLEITVRRPRRPDADRAIREARGERGAVGRGSGQHRLDAEAAAGADDAQGDLTAVGDEHAADPHAEGSRAMRSSTWPNSTSAPSCTQISTMVPRAPARTVFMSFMTSMMPMMVSSATTAPSSTNAAAPGFGAR